MKKLRNLNNKRPKEKNLKKLIKSDFKKKGKDKKKSWKRNNLDFKMKPKSKIFASNN